ncbi:MULTISPECIES: hypothetical protein [Priestia]|uniref:hypothetical protein n=1 Tax=Priestia TaxID=2800373 RepID=UPI000762371D|nr:MULTISPECIES: hypothetical protein [Priestia]KWU54142.1 hypothetical protein AWX17_07470 [Priestia megaterium]MBX9993891.1 hypothetical protein [Priestia aryabhattai]MED4059361.1 hypothetical protein [Priestia megaterium]
MDILDAKVVNTKYGLETYLDVSESVEIKEIHMPSSENQSHKIKFGIKYFLLREGKYYDSQKGYFWLCMNHDFSSLMLSETETESLFAVKSEEEREATKTLLAEWFIKTKAYKEVINECIHQIKTENIRTEEDIEDRVDAIQFLEKLKVLTAKEVENASIENLYALQQIG